MGNLAQAIELLKTLVGFDTTSRNSNLELIGFIESYLKQHGVSSTRIPSKDGCKANLLARIGPDAPGGLLLSGHTDVVPVDGQDWNTPPFAVTEKDGKLFGRGTCDMKGFIACCLALAPELAEAKLLQPVYFAFSFDEEVGCLGVRPALAHIASSGIKPALAIIGEPTLMKLATAHKGILSYETIAYGVEGHSSAPDKGVNAIGEITQVMNLLHDMAEEYKNIAPSAVFDPPYSTIHIGIIKGGTARNIIPRECSILWEVRHTDKQHGADIVSRLTDHLNTRNAELAKKHPQARIVNTQRSDVPALTPIESFPLQEKIMAAVGTNQTNTVAFGTEAGLFQQAGMPAIIIGPGSIAQAHAPDEYVETNQLEACLTFLRKVVF